MFTATVVGGLAALIPLTAVVLPALDHAGPTSTTTSRIRIDQGSPEAGALVRSLFEAGTGRVTLDVILEATPAQARNTLATNGIPIFYDCVDGVRQGTDDVGADRCAVAQVWWLSSLPSSALRNPAGWHLYGTYAVSLEAGKGQVYGAPVAAFALRSVAG